MITPSLFSQEGRTFTERVMTTIPRISVIWTKIEPRILPIAKSAASGVLRASNAAEPVTRISGNDVPIETIVRPITISAIPALLARPFAPSMKKSALVMSKPSERSKINEITKRLFGCAPYWVKMIPKNKAPVISMALKWISWGIPINSSFFSILLPTPHGFSCFCQSH